MNNVDKDILALLILNKKKFANAYQLCKVLAWKFNIIDCKDIIKRIKEKRYISIADSDSEATESFCLTQIGKQLLKEETKILDEKLKKQFPQETDFIDNLCQNEH